jgi:hypothetical protein
MSWYYADWGWVQSLVMTAAWVMTAGVVVCWVVTLIRAAAHARTDNVLVTNGFVPPSPAKLEGRRHAPHRRSGRWAA